MTTHVWSLILTTIETFYNVCVQTTRAIFRWCFPSYKDLTNEIILITGGGRGLGRRLALEFAKYKPKHIIIWGRNEEWLSMTRDDIIKLGVESTFCVCDVSVREQIYEKADYIKQTIGDVTMLVNNAGIVVCNPVLQTKDKDIEHTLKVNTLAHIWTIKAFLPAMIENKHGHIVSMTSILGLMGLKGIIDYAASKFSTSGLMESLLLELEDYEGIHITSVHPYIIDNSMFSGIKIRFPKLFPPLTEKYVTMATLQAVLTNRKQVVMPSLFHLVLLFRSILPRASFTPVFRFFWLDTVMDAVHK